MLKKLHLVVDLDKCVGCYNCMVACKDEHVGNDWPPYTFGQEKHGGKWINPTRYERGAAPYTDVCHVARLCNHCGDAPCQKAFPDAIRRREDGIVLINADKANNRELTGACPYGMISWNEELGAAQKCTMCAHLLDSGWTEPRCVQACPLRALSVVFCEDSEFDTLAENQKLRPLIGGECKPRVLYRNLYRYASCFIAGALAYKAGGIEKAAQDADVRLFMNGELLTETKTDFFGEFKIDRIPKNAGTFSVEFQFGGYPAVVREIEVSEDSVCLDVTYLGE